MIDFPPVPESLWQYEQLLQADGFSRVAGIDEAGRGPLAGPVVAAAVILPPEHEIEGLNDSKALSATRREALFSCLQETLGVEISIVAVGVEVIDRCNILQATHQAMRQAVERLAEIPDFALIDGLPVPRFPCPCRNVIKGDARCACIAAASIMAKVTRDRIMLELDQEYPQYGFARHKGYGTRDHLAALRRHGPCPSHRRTFRPVAELLNPPPVQGELDLF